MNILMIGHSRSGKTTYMAGLYARMKDGVAGYNISCSSYVQERDLNVIAENLSKGLYPDETMIHQEYNFHLSSYGEHSIPFNWYDYRGGSLMERTSTSKDANDLTKRISESNALIVFLDGDVLIQDFNANKRQYQRLVFFINKAICERIVQSEEYYPISFVITKGDNHEDDNLFDCPGIEYISEAIFSSIQKSSTVAGLLTVSEVNANNIYNVHFPLLFSIYHGLSGYARKVVSYYEYRLQNRSFLSDIGAFFFGDDDKEEALNKLEYLDSNRGKIMEILNENNNQSLIMF